MTSPSRSAHQLWLAILVAVAVTSITLPVAAATTALEALDEALLTDIIESHLSHEPTSCTIDAVNAATTKISFDWPGRNPKSDWFPDIRRFEQSTFQAIMSHKDVTGKRSWDIRIGRGGNIYSHFTPDMHGETWPPQEHDDAPWIDEVQQTISVNINLNKRNIQEYCPGFPNTKDKEQCKWYFIHQAGAYQQDSPYTDSPFYSSSLARHCSGNTCTFATWGTQAHVATAFTSPIIYINRYTNCDNGISELHVCQPVDQLFSFDPQSQ